MSRIHIPTPQEILYRRRLRLVCQFFKDLNKTNEQRDEADKGEDPNFLPEETVAEIAAYMQENSITASDLIAIRNSPGKWTLGNPYDWLWILHRYTNKYSNS